MNQPAIDIQAYQIVVTREFNTPRETVFKAWTEPKKLKKWFGPEGVNTIAAEVDLRIGGNYQLTMREPNGSTIVHGGAYREIDPPNKLVFT
jgi:uncharacterized protein YndB with AHSA1/START domain